MSKTNEYVVEICDGGKWGFLKSFPTVEGAAYLAQQCALYGHFVRLWQWHIEEQAQTLLFERC